MTRDSSSRRHRYTQRLQFLGDEEEEIKKGPWKEEEDQVLISHVHKYGPRDWSSIRSKGLLRRTGKSCRLRWVNKLRPNLKNGEKFSAEEERLVIELQSQIGNKWARIATHLPGRTDNDVKNFWSSRQKRLTRLLHNSNFPSPSQSTTFHEGETSANPPATKPESKGQGLQETLNSSSVVNSPFHNPEMHMMNMLPLTLPDLSTPPNMFTSQQLVVLEMPLPLQMVPDPCFCLEDVFGRPATTTTVGNGGGGGLVDNMSSVPLEPPCFRAPDGDRGRRDHDQMNDCCPEIPVEDIFEDFPPDMFDQIEALPSPSNW